MEEAPGVDKRFVVTAGAPGMSIEDFTEAITNLLNQIANPISQDPSTGRIRIRIEDFGATLGTVSTVTSISQFAGFPLKDTLMAESQYNCWANSIGSLVV